jgi:hypothetical protein
VQLLEFPISTHNKICLRFAPAWTGADKVGMKSNCDEYDCVDIPRTLLRVYKSTGASSLVESRSGFDKTALVEKYRRTIAHLLYYFVQIRTGTRLFIFPTNLQNPLKSRKGVTRDIRIERKSVPTYQRVGAAPETQSKMVLLSRRSCTLSM